MLKCWCRSQFETNMLTLVLLISHIFISTANEQKRERVVLGSSDYLEVANSSAFVDKTMSIKEIYKFPHVLVTAPRQFGKSTGLDMLKTFFSMPVDRLGGRDEARAGEAAELFRRLEIYTHESNLSYGKRFFDRHFGRYPVLEIGLGTERAVRSARMAEEAVMRGMHECFKRYGYLRDSDALSDEERAVCRAWCDHHRHLRLNASSGALNVLSRCLYKHHGGRKSLVLVDDYDAVIISCIINADDGAARHAIRLITHLLSGLVSDDRFVERSVVTGNSWMTWPGRSKPAGMKVCKFLGDHPLTGFTGFQKPQVDRLLAEFNTSERYRLHIDSWYNGYIDAGGTKTYNPFSVLSFLKTKLIERFWFKNETAQILVKPIRLESFRKQIESLRMVDVVNARFHEDISLDDIRVLEDVLQHGREPGAERGKDIFLSFLCDLGLLIPRKLDVSGKDHLTDGPPLRMPNKEMEDMWLELIIEYCLNEIMEKERAKTTTTVRVNTSRPNVLRTVKTTPLRRVVDGVDDYFNLSADT